MLSKTSTWYISDKHTKVVTMHPLLVIFANEKAAITTWIFGRQSADKLSLDNEYYCKNFFLVSIIENVKRKCGAITTS